VTPADVPAGEYISRPFGSYDPHEPLVIPYGDLLAARNAVAQLLTILQDPQDPPSEYQRDSVRLGTRFAVEPDGKRTHFNTIEEAVDWIVALRDRLGSYLPDLPTGRRQGT